MVDALDLKIIEKLKINSRVSYVDIGKQIGLSPSSVKRIQKLEDKEVIKGYQAEQSEIRFWFRSFIMFKLFRKLKTFVVN
jgi:Lrp/AsnC family leucine-responsive transcriptional regulator